MQKNALIALVDQVASVLLLPIAPVLARIGRWGPLAKASRGVFDRNGFAVVPHHFYTPIVMPADLNRPLDESRRLPGLDLNEQGQLDLIAQFKYADELRCIPMEKASETTYGYRNDSYGPGDAEMLYNMIRHFKPRRMLEIGSGQSTLMAQLAIAANTSEDPGYVCRFTCIEPYLQPWLESTGIPVIRKRVELLDVSLFASLEAGDILFIDSSHVVRTQGDVVAELLSIVPSVAPGVIIHIHDIFTPYDYPADWVVETRWLWTEQYLLEAFLAFNRDFEVLAGVHWLTRRHPEKLKDACPIHATSRHGFANAFWLRRRS